MNTLATNILVITGKIIKLEDLRYTPAGIPLLSFVILHVSLQTEADMQRKIELEMPVLALGKLALMAIQLKVSDPVKLTGFMAKRSLKSSQMVMHINKLEIN